MFNLNIAIIDDDKSQRELLSGFFKKLGCTVFVCDSGENCLSVIEKQYLDVVLTDFRMPGMNGLEILRRVRALNPEIQVIIMTAYGSIEDAVTAMHQGAWDYLAKPIDLDELEIKLQKIVEHNALLRENELLKTRIAATELKTEIIYKSSAMAEVLNLVARISDSQAAVLIQGESGTGKELIARAIHQASPRHAKPFVAINCAAIPETLFESELFGHEKGAYTGATERTRGRLEVAEGGTLFLDEVADIPLSFQVKLLRVLQEKEYQRLGAAQTLRTDVRIVSATNKNIQQLVDETKFRSDLFFRLNVIPIQIPPLRERREDIIPLVEHFIAKHARLNNRPIAGVSAEGMNLLMRYDYPGNVRELENIIERAVILARQTTLTMADLPLQPAPPATVSLSHSLNDQIENLERELLKKALIQTGNVQTRAAELLGISERVLRYKIEKYKIK
ncbi:MAG: sigma-54 dependent transcriptional regulator [Candidatus Marinimicrobia bacterium]|jgi:two-component system NtrC family response regulator|nr:sigma-54 dependent transcriptional regulator [Candidatus Neomarinimicrobiota bacterium]MCK9483031.1 sigma-54 dependent transcriptional regulator [Candidatus Neomarinimicrobiota bacterium]MCK9559187.1 sigma-54 dependent transcriptional regulator [Candidatus Neomarinimicrobiota bacterium]MDD5060859.1 sigma-54 dependent transcriptional regulator [Candidatus Neomarinimicrobiota bacterium]